MKSRNGAVARLIIWSVAAAALTAALVLLLTGRGRSALSGLWGSGIRWPETALSYADAEQYTAGGGEAALRDCPEVEINWISGSVKITGYDGNTIRFSEDYSGDRDLQLHYLVKDGKLTIQPCAANRGLNFQMPDKTLEVQVPNTGLEKLTVSTTSAEVSASGLQAGQLEAETVSGGISLEALKLGTLELSTTSGETAGSGVTADEVQAETTSGGAELAGAFGSFSGSSVSGDFRVRSDAALREADIDTTSGGVELRVPRDCGYTVEFDTVSGSLTSGFADRTPYVHGDGTADFSVNTVSGNLTIGPS